MTEKQLKARKVINRINLLLAQANVILVSQTPYRNGFMSRQWKYRLTLNGIEFYNDTPYLGYTDGVWTSPRWRGRKNPNEGWTGEAFELVVETLANGLGGEYVFN